MNCGAHILSQEAYGPKKLPTVLGAFFYHKPRCHPSGGKDNPATWWKSHVGQFSASKVGEGVGLGVGGPKDALTKSAEHHSQSKNVMCVSKVWHLGLLVILGLLIQTLMGFSPPKCCSYRYYAPMQRQEHPADMVPLTDSCLWGVRNAQLTRKAYLNQSWRSSMVFELGTEMMKSHWRQVPALLEAVWPCVSLTVPVFPHLQSGDDYNDANRIYSEGLLASELHIKGLEKSLAHRKCSLLAWLLNIFKEINSF